MNEQVPTIPAVPADFAGLIAPVSVDEFFTRYWNKRPLRIKGARGRFDTLFSRETFDALLPRCRQIKAGFRDARGWYTDLLVNADQVRRLVEANMTICAGVLPSEPRLDAFIAGYRRAVAFAGEVYFNAYLSPDGSGFSLHLDDHPVLVLQIEGSKHWWVWPEVGVANPPRSFSFPPDREVVRLPWGTYTRPDESRLLEFTLEPGDVLYVPAGAWHKTRAIGGSLALTMASHALTPLEVAQRALQAGIGTYPELLHPLWGGDAEAQAGDSVPATLAPVFEQTAAALQALVKDLDATTLYRVWRAAQGGRG